MPNGLPRAMLALFFYVFAQVAQADYQHVARMQPEAESGSVAYPDCTAFHPGYVSVWPAAWMQPQAESGSTLALV